VIRWLRSYLAERSARLCFDGEKSKEIRVPAGVPQGSPLSPILFILYSASLYEALAKQPGIVISGFADDINLLAFGRTDAETTPQLERAWGICEAWAKTRGM